MRQVKTGVNENLTGDNSTLDYEQSLFFPNPSSEKRETRVTLRVTKGTRMPPSSLASARRFRARLLHSLNLKKKRVQLIHPNRPLPSPHTFTPYPPPPPLHSHFMEQRLSIFIVRIFRLFVIVLFCFALFKNTSQGLETLKHTYAHQSLTSKHHKTTSTLTN